MLGLKNFLATFTFMSRIMVANKTPLIIHFPSFSVISLFHTCNCVYLLIHALLHHMTCSNHKWQYQHCVIINPYELVSIIIPPESGFHHAHQQYIFNSYFKFICIICFFYLILFYHMLNLKEI